MKRVLTLLAATVVLVAAFVPTAAYTQEATDDCGLTTLDGTIVVGADGTLECGPGQEIVVRTELADPSPERVQNRRSLLSFGAIADVQLADEESPLRGEWADKCESGSPISNSAWRPQEAFVPHLLNAHIKALDAIAAAGSPVLGDDLDLVVGLGDLADNQQLNEIRWIIDLFDGDTFLNPDTGNDPVLGGDGYDGVQAQDPEGSGAPLPGPEQGGPPVDDDSDPTVLDEQTLLDLANEPFWAQGLRVGDLQIPWYSLPGNHDVKVQGTIDDDAKAWRDMVRRYAIGHTKLMELAPDYQARLCRALTEGDQVLFQSVMMDILSNPERAGTTRIVPSDPDRLPLYRSDEAKGPGDAESCFVLTQLDGCDSSWIEEHFNTTGLPVGHGYGEGRCTDAEGNLLARACYAFEHGDFLFVALDTNPSEGLESGNIDGPQFEWLERTLREHSTNYFDETGQPLSNEGVTDKMVVVLTHHTISSTDNLGLYSSAEGEGAPDLPLENEAHDGEDLKELLLRYPNVILQASGHTHQNKIWAHRNDELGTGYWEINTSAIADAPHQSRTIEIADNGDGTLSIFGVVFDAAVAPDPRDIHWTGDDHTHELDLTANHTHGHEHPHEHPEVTQNVNEDWLASFGREVGFYDPQDGFASGFGPWGSPADQNVELLIRAPFDLGPSEVATELTYSGATTGRIGRDIPVSASLTDPNGTGIPGMTILFARGDQVASAVTDAAGVAAATLRVGGPKGTSAPLTVSFGGSGSYLPAWLEVPFTATSGKG